MKPVRRVLRAIRLTPTLLKRSVAEAWKDRVLGLSAEAAFWQMLSLPSLFLALIATLGYVSRWFGPGTVDRVETQIEDTLARAFSPEVVDKVISPTLREVLRGDRADIISIGFALALWAGSSATATFVNTITIAYGQRDQRGAVRSRLLALWLFLGTVVLGVILLPMLVLGPDLLRKAVPQRSRHTVSDLISVGYYPTLIVLLMLGLTTFYKLAPPRRLPWRRGLPGATLALLVFLGGSAGLREYINFILDQNHAYGTLAAPIAALLFFFILALGVLLGAEFNAAIEKQKPAKIKPAKVLDPRHWQIFSGPLPIVDRVTRNGRSNGADGHGHANSPDEPRGDEAEDAPGTLPGDASGTLSGDAPEGTSRSRATSKAPGRQPRRLS